MNVDFLCADNTLSLFHETDEGLFTIWKIFLRYVYLL